MSASDITVVALVILVIKFMRHIFRDTSYVGYGWKIGWREGHVYVVSRLLKSPSGRAGVLIGTRIRRYRGKSMDFPTIEEFESFMKANPRPALGQRDEFTIFDGKEKTISLTAERIYDSIPVHRPLPHIDSSDEWRYRYGMFFCTKTGMIVHTRTLSDMGLRALYG